jgi:hypothetical protein
MGQFEDSVAAQVVAGQMTQEAADSILGASKIKAEKDDAIAAAQAVAAWARDRQLIAASGPTAEEIAAHERMSNVGAAGAALPPPADLGTRVANLRTRMERAGALELGPLKSEVLDLIASGGHTFGDVVRDPGSAWEHTPDSVSAGLPGAVRSSLRS